jgi:hypothetical protein
MLRCEVAARRARLAHDLEVNDAPAVHALPAVVDEVVHVVHKSSRHVKYADPEKRKAYRRERIRRLRYSSTPQWSSCMACSVAYFVVLAGDRQVTDSLRVANHFGKRHDNVLNALDKLECSERYRLLNFKETITLRPNPKGGK